MVTPGAGLSAPRRRCRNGSQLKYWLGGFKAVKGRIGDAMTDDEREGSLGEVVERYIPAPARIMCHIGIIVLVSLTAWLAFFWFAPRSLMVPSEATGEIAPAAMTQVRLFLGLIYGLTTVIIAVLAYGFWLVWQGRKARRHVLASAQRRSRR